MKNNFKKRRLQTDLERRTREFESRLNDAQKEKEEVEKRLQKELENKSKEESSAKTPSGNIEIIDLKSMEEYETVENIGNGSSGQVFKVAKKTFYAKKNNEHHKCNRRFSSLFEWAWNHEHVESPKYSESI